MENYLKGKALSEISIQRAVTLLKAAIHPLSDVRASAAYRSEIAANMLDRALREQSGEIIPAITAAV